MKAVIFGPVSFDFGVALGLGDGESGTLAVGLGSGVLGTAVAGSSSGAPSHRLEASRPPPTRTRAARTANE